MLIPQARRITAVVGFWVCSLDISDQAQTMTGTLKKIAGSLSIAVGIRQALLPFSSYDNNQQGIGYSADLCKYVLTAIQSKLGLDALNVKQMAVTSATRIPLLSNGTIDMECGATTNNAERAKQIEIGRAHV